MQDKSQKSKYNLWQNSGWMLRLAWRHARSVPLLCVAMALCAAGKSILELLLAPVVLARIESGAALAQLLTALLGMTGGLLAASLLHAYIEQNTTFARIDLRCKHILAMIAQKRAGTSYPNTLDPAFLAKSEAAGRAIYANTAAAEAIWDTWTVLLTSLICFAVYLALLSGLQWWLILLVTATSAGGYFASKYINEWGYRHRTEREGSIKQINYVNNTAANRAFAKDIRMFGLQAWLRELRDDAMHLYRAFLARRERAYLWANVIDLTLSFLRNGAAYAYLLWLTLTRGLSAAQFLLYFSAVTGFTQWVTSILDQFSTLHKQCLEISTVREFLEWPEPFRMTDGAPVSPVPGHAYELRLEDVSFRYPEAQADTISHMNLTIHPSERLAIVGLNGAGKSTLVKLLCGFLDPTEGRVLLDGRDIREFNRPAYYTLFSAVFQDFSVLDATVAENVAQRIDGIDTARVRRCLDAAGLTEKVDSLPGGLDAHIGRAVFDDGVELSGGQTQRLMLARALYKDGPILVLDEPTAALDPIAENDIYQKYSGMTAGRTSVFISHRLASTRFCDWILFLEHGRIAEEGSHESLLARGGGYASLFEIQSRYYQEGGATHAEEV